MNLSSRVLNRALYSNYIALAVGPFVGIAYSEASTLLGNRVERPLCTVLLGSTSCTTLTDTILR